MIHQSPTSHPGKLIVFTGPSGVGKGTLLRSLLKRYPELYLSLSVTTRSPRVDEVHGQHYYFVTRQEFAEMIANHQLLEWAEFAGNFYGTPHPSGRKNPTRTDCNLRN